jgi:hypothetical protein
MDKGCREWPGTDHPDNRLSGRIGKLSRHGQIRAGCRGGRDAANLDLLEDPAETVIPLLLENGEILTDLIIRGVPVDGEGEVHGLAAQAATGPDRHCAIGLALRFLFRLLIPGREPD